MTMKTFYVFLADGFEEVEALTPVDVLRRAGLNVKTVSVMPSRAVNGAHGVPVVADLLFEEVDKDQAEMLILPGGMPGATNLDAHDGLSRLIHFFAEQGKPLAAICAAPLVYGKRGLLRGKKATCYPGFEKYLEGADYTAALVQEDGNFITGKGPGAAMEFAFAIVRRVCGEPVVKELKQGMMIAE
jgi:4-methyl-5(b-hydroxyethyl)-thiazole monophosphate biosynthesis